MKLHVSLFFLILFSCSPTFAGPFFYDEAVSGPLSNNQSSPTALAADIGDNVIKGDIDQNSAGDFFTFTVPFDTILPSIVVDSMTNQADFTFVVATEVIDWQDQAPFIYFGETDDSLIGQNLLTELGIGPLSAGPYWFCIGSDDGSMHDYQMTLSIIPEPASVTILVMGFGLITLQVRRRH